MKSWRDCRHGRVGDASGFPYCNAPHEAAKLVQFAHSMRTYGSPCGPEAKLHDPIESVAKTEILLRRA